MATARLRRTFHYPDSEDDEAVEEGMDERDQEDLIAKLSSRDTTSTTLYTHLLLILPLAPLLFYLPRLFHFSTVISSILAIGSLLSSAYTLYFLPLPPVSSSTASVSDKSRKGKSISRDPTTGARSASSWTSPESRPVPYLSTDTVELLRKYIIPLNASICAVLALVELLSGRTWSEGMMIGGGIIDSRKKVSTILRDASQE
ncbi:uncharacterized protein EI97DRAFT_499063 [Westerdykella ornata]|uniref:Uncharacterized protein n=1 Tax=Westerdykella ornata TaxID=318751 RepID=A0A6A6JX67_WESOR|nr:uncharacterized protein EI97DRAFT_499063 [Westerdykella ornata]KAF2279659.1 hypothetical protein EI97DRAFT_499063 [Westerdykella ornata]